ncbi:MULTISPECIES: phage tail spike protein [Bacillus]|uniref:phage tail spike protein n=1 Tax=Bacillus TaxID=1386 RepID=UPI00301757F8
MRTPSGTLHVVDFKKSQIVSAIQPKDYWDDKRHWEIKNNIDILEFRVFDNTDHAATLIQQNLVLKEVRGGRIVPYVITEAEKDSDDKSLMVYASGEWIQLAKSEIIEPQKIERKTLKQCMEIALKGTKWEIGKTEHDGAHSFTIDEFIDPLNLLKKIAASFELEIQYRAEVVGSQIVVRYVDMVKKRGRDTRKEVTFGKDLMGIKRIENSQNICTALLGFVKKENEEFITISSINNGVPYIVDDAAYQRWNENGKHKFAFYTPQTDNQNMSPERLLTLMKTEMGKLVNTSVSYAVDVQNIARIPSLAHEEINEGDTIRIIDEGFTPKLYLEARAIAGDESFKDPKQDKYMFGDYREIVDQNDELRRLYQKILSSLYDKVPQELFDQLKDKVNEQNQSIIDAKDKANQAQKESQEAKDLAEATVDYIEKNTANVIEQPTAPTEGLKNGKTIWVDNSDQNNRVMKLWKDGAWVRVTPDTKSLEDAVKQINTAVGDVTGAVNQAEQDITKLKQDVAGIPDVVFKDGRFTDIKLTVEQTEESLLNKAEKTEMKQLSEDLTGVSQTVNIVKQTSDENSSKITTLDTSFKNMKFGRTNVIENSGNFQDALLWIPNNIGAELEAVTLDGERVLRVKGTTRHAKSYHLEPNTEYVYSAMVKLPLDHWHGFNDPLHSWTKQGDNLHTATRKWAITPDGTIKANEWTYIAVGIKTAEGEPTQFTPFFFSESLAAAQQNSYIKFFQVTKGNQPVADWIPPISEGVSSKEFIQTTNEIKQTAEENTSTITKLQGSISNENHLYDSSANHVLPKFVNGVDSSPYHIFNAEHKFENDYSTFKCLNWKDSFYQIGDYLTDNLRGFGTGEDITLSLDLASESNYVEVMVFQHINGQWTVPTNKFFKFENTDWKRVDYTFKLDHKCKGWMFRIRMDAREENQNKRWWIRNLKLEKGSFVTPWLTLNASTQELNRQTNEIKQTVGENSAKITSVEVKVNKINDDVTNLLIDSSTFNGAIYQGINANARWWLKDARMLKVSLDTFDGSAVAETDLAWQGIAYNFGDLIKRGVVKAGDRVNYSLYTRIKGLPDGESRQHTFYFIGDATQILPAVTNQWKRIDVSFTVTATMLTCTGDNVNDFMRAEQWERLPEGQWYQQSKPQLTIGEKVYTWRPAPEDTNTIISKTNEIKQTVDANAARITRTEGAISNFKSLNNIVRNSTMNDVTNGVPDFWFMPYDQFEILKGFPSKPMSNVFKVWASGLTAVNIRSAQTHKIPAKSGVTYTFSCDMLVSRNTPWDYQIPFIIQFYDKDGQRIEYQDISITSVGIPLPIEAEKWHRLVLTYTPQNPAITHLDMRPSLFKNGEIYYREFQVEVGSSVTGWSPSQEDLVRSKVFNTKTSEMEQTVDSIRTSVSSISQTQGKQGQLIQENSSSISQLNNQIQSKVSENQMQDYVGRIGETNLILNAPFSYNTIDAWGNIVEKLPSIDKWGSWTAEGSKGKFIPVTNVKYGGYNSIHIQCSDYQGENSWTGINQVFGDIDPQSAYTYRAMVFTTNKNGYDKGLFAEIKAWNGDKLIGAVGANINEVLETNMWREYNVTIPPMNQAVTHMQITCGVVRNGGFHMSNPMFQKGSTKSVFIPNPKDMGDYQAMIRELAKKLATSDFNNKVTQMETTINQQSDRINLKAEAKEVYTISDANGKFGSKAIVESHTASLEVMANQINSTVKKGDVISSINQSAERIKISADLIDLVGRVEASWLKAGLLQGMTIKTSNTSEYLHMENQVLRFVNQGSDKIVIGFENEWKSRTSNPYIVLGQGSGNGRNFGSIYKDNDGVYYRYVDNNGAESDIRLTAQGNIGITAQDGIWVTSKRANFTAPIETPAIKFNSFGSTPGSQQGTLWMGHGYNGFGVYFYNNGWNYLKT